MKPGQINRYGITSYESELRAERIKRHFSWIILLFLIGTNIITAANLIEARNQAESRCRQ